MRKKLKIVVSALILVVAVFLVMYLLSEGSKREVRNVIIAYIDVLKRAHLEGDPALMNRVTSEWQRKKIDSYIASNIKSGRLINGALKEISFNEITVKDNIANVATTERWIWFYVDPRSGKPVSEVFDEVNGSTYHLKKLEGRWIVDDIISEVVEQGRG